MLKLRCYQPIFRIETVVIAYTELPEHIHDVLVNKDSDTCVRTLILPLKILMHPRLDGRGIVVMKKVLWLCIKSSIASAADSLVDALKNACLTQPGIPIHTQR